MKKIRKVAFVLALVLAVVVPMTAMAIPFTPNLPNGGQNNIESAPPSYSPEVDPQVFPEPTPKPTATPAPVEEVEEPEVEEPELEEIDDMSEPPQTGDPSATVLPVVALALMGAAAAAVVLCRSRKEEASFKRRLCD